MEDNNECYSFVRKASYPLLELFKNAAELVLTQSFLHANRSHLHTIMFQLEATLGTRKWRIIKTFQNFMTLRQSLLLRYANYLMPFPIQDHPDQTELLQTQLLEFFQLFLNRAAAAPGIAEEPIWVQWIGRGVGQGREAGVMWQGYLSKRNWGHHNEWGFKKIFQFLASWERRFFTITRDGVHFTAGENSYDILDSLMFSTTFGFACGQAATGYSFGVLINSSHRVLQLDAGDVFTFGLFVHFLARAVQECKNIRTNRYDSFARVRGGCEAEYFVDGQDYFNSLCQCLLAAKEEVFITGWMISPFFSLRRPDPKEQYRVDQILKRLAKAGVRINIVIYNGPKMALSIDSAFTQQYLSSLSPNIRILMHPNYIMIPFIWSHHQKMVIVDQTTAFIGGLDLGYGRFDSKLHLLTDPAGEFWPGVDYCNYRVTDIYSPRDFRTCSVDRKRVPRMPWHDVGVRLVGGSVQDLSRHFIQYWNHVNIQLSMGDRQLLMYVGLNSSQIDAHKQHHQEEEARQAFSIKHNRKALGSWGREREEGDLEAEFDFLNLESKQKEKTRSAVVRSTSQEEPSQMSYSSSIYDAVGTTHQQQMQFYASHLQDVSKLEQFFNKFNPKNILTHRLAGNFQTVTLAEGNLGARKGRQTQRQQIVRSESMWSIGVEQSQTESSILNAYYDLIGNARQFIYIENQFFVSQENKVTKRLIEKILEAVKEKRKFRVVVLLPALPGFQGHPADERAAVFRVQVHLHLQNINYVYRKLRRVPNIDQYLYFFSLRTHALLGDRPVTEIIYIHSKIMIVDDSVALIGSANINDRSLLGNRDSELAVVMQDQQKTEIKIGQQPRFVSSFAHSLRKQLYMQHFALSDSEATDYFNDDIWEAMIQISRKNHYIYRQLFGCYPDDQMNSFSKMAEIEAEADPSKYELLAPLIKGHAIPFQRHFLADENLELRPSQKEYFIPAISFT